MNYGTTGNCVGQSNLFHHKGTKEQSTKKLNEWGDWGYFLSPTTFEPLYLCDEKGFLAHSNHSSA
jgi:hypothetical protein